MATLTSYWQEIGSVTKQVTSNTTGKMHLFMRADRYSTYDRVYFEIRFSASNPYGDYFAWSQEGTMDWSFSYNGQSVSGSYSSISITSNQDPVTKASGYIDVYHTSAYSGTASATGVIYKESKSCSGTAALTTIATKSSVSVSSDPYLGKNAVTISCSNTLSTGITHTIKIINPNNTSQYIEQFTNVGASKSWTPPLFNDDTLTEYAYLITGESRTFTVECETFYNGSSLGKSTCTTTIHVPNDETTKPTMQGGEFNISDLNTTIPQAWRNANVYVQSKSKLRFAVQAVTKAAAGMGTASVLIDGSEYSAVSTNQIDVNVDMDKAVQSAGSLPIKANVSDTRGFRWKDVTSSNWETLQTITVTKYITPSFDGEPQISRVNANGNPDDRGTYLAFSLKARISAVTTGSTHRNTATFKIKWKTKSSTTWNETTYSGTLDTTADDYVINISSQKLKKNGTDVTISADSAYDIRFELIDAFNTTSNPVYSTADINVGGDLLNFNVNGHALAIGQLSTASQNEEKLEVAYPTTFKSLPKIGNATLANALKSAFLDMFYPVGSYYETSNTNFNPNTAWGGTWVEDSQGRMTLASGTPVQNTITNHGSLTQEQITSWVWNTGELAGEYNHQLGTSEIPAHTHGSKSLTGSATNVMWDDGRSGGIAASGIVSVGGWTRNRSWTGTNGDASRALNINASHEHDSVGGNGRHNNVPPIVVVKRWHRTA